MQLQKDTVESRSVVVLIDADNAQLSSLDYVLEEAATYGRLSVKRAYGNWVKDNLAHWPEVLKKNAVKAVQQFDYVKGKNSSDIAMVIDAMDLLHSSSHDVYVLVSSDSDFAALGIRLKESGKLVIGMGKASTPDGFKKACDEFVILADRATAGRNEEIENCAETVFERRREEHEGTPIRLDVNELHRLLSKAWGHYAQDNDEFLNVCTANQYIRRIYSDFDIKLLGYDKLPSFLRSYPDLYEVKAYPGKGTVTIVGYRCKNF